MRWLDELVAEHGGWWERGADEDVARFPTVEQKDRFVAAVARATVAAGKEVRIRQREEGTP